MFIQRTSSRSSKIQNSCLIKIGCIFIVKVLYDLGVISFDCIYRLNLMSLNTVLGITSGFSFLFNTLFILLITYTSCLPAHGKFMKISCRCTSSFFTVVNWFILFYPLFSTLLTNFNG